ncbi:MULTISPECIES: TVP38/TMEM64 family protein [Dyadobacter]|uniref:TVP38/TMEM64 family membrane protein n=1 Tax=Dyadobacter chenhuakuii TaxID=2909339 RepID=A0A9X1QHP5_9BACT|nr:MULTISPECIES: VTT domain-containing protein [Dyadobacter]MCF2495655.1 VTT domain-containing protein [Dyadobacter chenhuakuii]MCF2499894.1 VTT domain-containing protein [Dyadobacter chenhuakuii]MCF2520138.1 VTT domain-containing protein [Dyadobacter sp. CY351]USJ29689.1 VTT domain-containing protein [Dyadobacter chenhuakuii]
METSSPKKLSLPVIISILLTVVPLVTTSIATAWAVGHESQLRSWPFEWWVIATLILTLASSVALTPPTFLALVYGYFLGWTALPLLFGLNLGAIAIIYASANFLHASSIRGYLIQVYPQVNSLLRRFYQNELRLIFFAKLSPVLPFAITNLFFAMAGARFKQVIAGGTLGMIPRTVLAVWAGREARDIRYLLEHPNEGLATKIILILLIVVSTIGIGYFFKDKKIAE